MMWQHCAIFFIIFAGVYATRNTHSNEYVDYALHNVLPNETKLSNVDPAELGNFSVITKDRLLLMDVNVKLNYYNGIMTGLSKVERAGNCSTLETEHTNVTIRCMLIFNDIGFRYNGRMKYGKMPSKGINGFATMTGTYALMDITGSVGKPSYVKNVELMQIGSIKAWFNGLGLLNNKLKRLTQDAFVSHAEDEFRRVFKLNWSPTLSRTMGRVDMPRN